MIVFNVPWVIFSTALTGFIHTFDVTHVMQPFGLNVFHNLFFYFFIGRCEQLLGVNGNLRQELMLVKRDHGGAEFHTLQESLAHLLQTLIQRYAGLFQIWERSDCNVLRHHAITTDDYAIFWKMSVLFLLAFDIVLFLSWQLSSLVVDKQPPQVIKTQSKFSTTVRYLLGEKMAPGKPVLLKAQIITEAQARQGVVPK